MKFNKIFSVLTAAALLGGAWSCTDKVEPTPSPTAGNQEVYFPYNVSAQVEVPIDATQVQIEIDRVKADAELTVALTVSPVVVMEEVEGAEVPKEADGIFTIPTSVTFPAGEKSVMLTIGVDYSKVVFDTEYLTTISIDGAETSAYGLGERTFTLVSLPWKEWELYSESDPGVYQQAAMWDYEYDTPVYVRGSYTDETQTQYMVLSPFSDLEYEQIIQVDETTMFDVDGVQCPLAYMPEPINTPIMNTNYGDYYSYITTWSYLYDVVKYYSNTGEHFEWDDIPRLLEANQWHVPYYNPEKGRFFLYMILYIPSIVDLGNFGESLETLQLPGDFHDYYFTFLYEGNLVDKAGTEFAMVQVVPSTDIEYFACKMLPGELTEEELAQAYADLEDDEDAELIYDASYTIRYAIDGDGPYTAIAIGYGADNTVVVKDYATYKVETVQKQSDYYKVGYVDYYDGILSGFFTFDCEMMSVMLEEHKEYPGVYRLVNPYETWSYLEYRDISYGDEKYYMLIDATHPDGGVVMPTWQMGVHIDGYGNPIVLSDAYYDMEYQGASYADIIAAGNGGTLEDGSITFPNRGLLMQLPEYASNPTALFYTNLDPDTKDGVGVGQFEIDMSMVMSAPRKVAVKSALPTTSELARMVRDAAPVKAQKAIKVAKKAAPTMDEVRQLRSLKPLKLTK